MRMPPLRLVALVLIVTAATSCSNLTDPSAGCGGAVRNRITSFPSGWGGGAPNGYVLGTDHSCRHGGSGAGFLSSTVVNPVGFTTLTQTIKADDFRGKRVRWRGWVRSEDVANYGGLWMRVDGPGETQAFDNSFNHPIKGTSGWREVEVVLDVRENAIGIAFGVLLSGPGDITVDDLVMEVVPMSVASTDTYLVPIPNDIPASQTQAGYSTRPTKGSNFNFEGGALLVGAIR
jgi:hypothetical protein